MTHEAGTLAEGNLTLKKKEKNPPRRIIIAAGGTRVLSLNQT